MIHASITLIKLSPKNLGIWYKNPIITQRSKAAHKVNLLLLTKNPRKISVGSPPLINPTFLDLLINASLKLHYRYISISAHRDSATPSETPGLFATLQVV